MKEWVQYQEKKRLKYCETEVSKTVSCEQIVNSDKKVISMASESLDQLLNAEFKEAFDEFDKV